MVTLDKVMKIKEIDIFLDKEILNKQLEQREKEFLLKWWLSFNDSYNKTMNFISNYNN